MATSTGEVEKINVRSPFYLTVNSDDAPPDYTPPATLTQPVGCGEQINVGEDVGTRIYEVDVSNRSGTFRINYTIYRPIKITYQLTEDSAPTVVGYLGGDTHKQELIDLGVPSSELTNLESGDFDNSYIQITRTSDATSTLTITVEAPLATDEYRLLMQCPDETVITEPATNPSLPTVNSLVPNTEAMYFSFRREEQGHIREGDGGESLEIYINGTLTDTLSPAALNWNSNTDKDLVIIFSNQDGYSFPTAANKIAVATSGATLRIGQAAFSDVNKTNTIGFRFVNDFGGEENPSVRSGKFHWGITQLFNNNGTLNWADEFGYGNYNNYNHASPFVDTIPRQYRESFIGYLHRFDAKDSSNPSTEGKIYGFHFNPEAIGVASHPIRLSMFQRIDGYPATIDGLKIYEWPHGVSIRTGTDYFI